MAETSRAQADAAPQGRPTAITVVCIIGFIGALLSVPLLFTDAVQQTAPWYPPYLAITSVVGLVCLIGLWLMRKWAVYAYTAMAAINQVILLATGLWNPLALLIPGVVVIVMFIHLPQMR